MAVTFSLSAQAEAKLKARLTEEFGKRVEKTFHALHKQVLSRTPMNSGKTLSAWAASRNNPLILEGQELFFNHGTNNMAVGTEPGRSAAEALSLATAKGLNIAAQPFGRFLIANGASLDSIGNRPEGQNTWAGRPIGESSLQQGSGSRAYYQEGGIIAGYSPFSNSYEFNPRGIGMAHYSVEYVRLNFKDIVKI